MGVIQYNWLPKNAPASLTWQWFTVLRKNALKFVDKDSTKCGNPPEIITKFYLYDELSS